MTRKCGAWGHEHTPYKNTEQNYGADDDFWRHLRVEHNDLSTYPWMSLDVFGANAWNILEPSCAVPTNLFQLALELLPLGPGFSLGFPGRSSSSCTPCRACLARGKVSGNGKSQLLDELINHGISQGILHIAMLDFRKVY